MLVRALLLGLSLILSGGLAWAVDPAAIDAARARFKPPGNTAVASIFDLVGIKPHPGQPIAYVASARFLGDSLVFNLGKIAALHRLFPESKIRVIHPFAERLVETTWLQPVPIPYEDHPANLERRAGAEVAPEDFVYSDDARVMNVNFVPNWLASRGERALILSTDLGTSYDGTVELRISGRYWSGGHCEKIIWLRGPELDRPKTIFEKWDLQTRLLYGGDNGLRWSEEIFLNPAAEQGAHAFLARTFHSDASVPYAVLNLNTGGLAKRDELRKDYAERLRVWVTAVLAKPEMRVLITAPEDPKLPPQIVAEVGQIIADFRGRAAYMPPDLNLWLIKFARYIVTQDSGFNWMSLTVQSPRNVLTSFTARQGSFWRVPDQPFHETADRPFAGPETAVYDRDIVNWIAEQNKSIDCNSDLHRH